MKDIRFYLWEVALILLIWGIIMLFNLLPKQAVGQVNWYGPTTYQPHAQRYISRHNPERLYRGYATKRLQGVTPALSGNAAYDMSRAWIGSQQAAQAAASQRLAAYYGAKRAARVARIWVKTRAELIENLNRRAGTVKARIDLKGGDSAVVRVIDVVGGEVQFLVPVRVTEQILQDVITIHSRERVRDPNGGGGFNITGKAVAHRTFPTVRTEWVLATVRTNELTGQTRKLLKDLGF